MALVDRLMGPVDEWMISRMIANWRDRVWERATLLLQAGETSEKERVLRLVEEDTLRQADAILTVDWSTALRNLR